VSSQGAALVVDIIIIIIIISSSSSSSSSDICNMNMNIYKFTFREGVLYVKTQLSCILLCYADDDMFRLLWAVFRSQKCI